MTIGDRIKEERERLGSSAEEFAGKSDVKSDVIMRAEDGDINNLTVKEIESLAKALQTDSLYLMCWRESDIFG